MYSVYSAGTTTPSPSPRLARKTYASGMSEYSRPASAHYAPGLTPTFGLNCRQQGHSSSHIDKEGVITLRDSIPAMKKPVAITCLVLNIIFPGLGTLISGLTVLCGSVSRPAGYTTRHVIWINAGVAGVQFVTAFIFLLGWIWSIMWGSSFLSISDEFYKKNNGEHTSLDHHESVSLNGGNRSNRNSLDVPLRMTDQPTIVLQPISPPNKPRRGDVSPSGSQNLIPGYSPRHSPVLCKSGRRSPGGVSPAGSISPISNSDHCWDEYSDLYYEDNTTDIQT